MNIQLKNDYIILKALKDEDITTQSGLIIPKETQNEDQVAKGKVLENGNEYKKNDILLFHKIVPIDVELKIEGKLTKV